MTRATSSNIFDLCREDLLAWSPLHPPGKQSCGQTHSLHRSALSFEGATARVVARNRWISLMRVSDDELAALTRAFPTNTERAEWVLGIVMTATALLLVVCFLGALCFVRLLGGVCCNRSGSLATMQLFQAISDVRSLGLDHTLAVVDVVATATALEHHDISIPLRYCALTPRPPPAPARPVRHSLAPPTRAPADFAKRFVGRPRRWPRVREGDTAQCLCARDTGSPGHRACRAWARAGRRGGSIAWERPWGSFIIGDSGCPCCGKGGALGSQHRCRVGAG